MESVNISKLKAQLTGYLRKVKNGQRIRVLDRTVPIAEIRPIGTSPKTDRAQLETEKPTKPLGELKALWNQPVKNVATIDPVDTLLADRLARF